MTREALTKAKTEADLEKAIGTIRDQREKTLRTRILARTLVDEMRKHLQDEKVVSFAVKVSSFFYCTEVARSRKMSSADTFVELCDYVQQHNLAKGLLIDYVHEALQHMAENSAAIASAYSAVRLHCLCPQRYYVKKSASD